MDKTYAEIMQIMGSICNQIYKIGELAESTSFFPVTEYVNLQDDFYEFYQILRGASKKATELNYKVAKESLSSRYGMSVTMYSGTDSLKRKSEDGHQD